MKIGELFVQLGVTADTFTVKDFTKAVGEIPVAAAAAVTVLTTLGFALFELGKDTLDLSNTLNLFTSQTGLSAVELQRWQAVATQVGLSGNVVESSIMGINKALADLRQGNGAVLLPLGRLGVAYHGQDTMQLFKQIGAAAAKFKNPGDASLLLSQMGISPEMMRIFSLPEAQRNKMMAVGPVVNESDMKAMADFQQALGRFEIVIEKSFVPALIAIEPHMEALANVLSDIIVIAGKTTGGILGGLGGIRSFKEKMDDPRSDDWIVHGGTTTWESWKRSHPVHQETHITQNIHSTADPEEVARIATEHHRRELNSAQKTFNNVGR